jgi:hypothetical protein
LVPTPLIFFGTSPNCRQYLLPYTLGLRKMRGLFCLFGSSRKTQKKNNGQKKLPTDNKNIRKNGVLMTEKNGFLVL